MPTCSQNPLSYLHRIPDRDFAAYGASAEQISRMRREFAEWEESIHTTGQ
jgi:hypothetical protein